jgi:predicted nucleic acid-binding protein
MTASDLAMLDSNVLVYASQKESRFYQSSKAIRDKGLSGEIPVCVCPQVLFEFFAVITNSGRATRSVAPQDATIEIEKYLKIAKILKIYPDRKITENVLELLKKHNVNSQAIFDLPLVATMLANDVRRIYAYNIDHFKLFTDLDVVTP